jgi:hypothetical protein
MNRRHMVRSVVGVALIPAAPTTPSREPLATELKRLLDRSPDTLLKASLLVVHGAHLAGKDSELSRLLVAYAQREIERLR